MGYKKIGPIRQVWYTLKYAIHSWIEWQDAKCWAKEYHPAWLAIVQNRRASDYTRQIYKQKILLAYRGYEYV